MGNLTGKPSAVYRNRMERYPDEWWLIWSNKWGCWYRANGRGYTDHIDMAGIYSREQAALHMAPEGTPKKHRDTEPFPISVVRAHIRFRRLLLDAEHFEASARLDQLDRCLEGKAP